MRKLPHVLFQNIVCADETKFAEKFARFTDAGANKLHIVYDFDRTLTVSHAQTQEDVTTWNLLKHHLPAAGKSEYAALIAKYRPLELTEQLSEEQAIEWWEASLEVLVRYKVNIPSVEQEFVHRASIRPGTMELFLLSKQIGVPVVILSAGIHDVIDIWARRYGVEPTLVLSTVLELDKQGTVTGWDKNTLIHALNKHEADHEDLLSIRKRRPNTILVGDGMGDADMASGSDNVLRIRMFDPRPDEVVDNEVVRKQTFTRFDAMIESGTFSPVLDLLKVICGVY